MGLVNSFKLLFVFSLVNSLYSFSSFSFNLWYSLKNENKIIIPYDNNLVNSFKEMLLNKKLDFSYALSVVDMDLLRSHMEKYSIDLSFYDEFDKLEDDLDECLNNFFKFTNEELLNYLTKEEDFILTNDNKLIKLL